MHIYIYIYIYIYEVQVMGSIINELSNNIGKRWLGQSENMLCLLHTGSSRVGLEGGVGVTQMHQDGGGAPSLFG